MILAKNGNITSGHEIIFLEPLDKIFDGILLRYLYLLFFLHQKSFLVVLQETQHGFVRDMFA